MRHLRLIPLILVAAVSGCGAGGPPTASVSGVVTYQGEPVKHAKVMFFPQGIPDAVTGFAQTDEEGKFTEVISGTKTGAFVGSNWVTITEEWPPDEEVPEDSEGMQLEPPRGPWAQKYRDSSDPAIKVEIAAGQDNQFTWEISE